MRQPISNPASSLSFETVFFSNLFADSPRLFSDSEDSIHNVFAYQIIYIALRLQKTIPGKT